MKIIVPMAGRGSRLRPHTLTIPKPMIPIAGRPIVHRLVEDIARMSDESVDEIAFIIARDFGEKIEESLLSIAKELGSKGNIYYQDQPLGTAHAILCAGPALEGNVIIAFADTLFRADFRVEIQNDGIIWVHQVDDPSAFGVVKTNDQGIITDFVEKPGSFVSDQAIIGIYYFKDGQNLKKELEYIIENDIRDKGEYQLTSALENMKEKGKAFIPGTVDEWLDCGNKDVTVHTNKRILEFNKDMPMIADDLSRENVIIHPPCYVGKGVNISNSVIGPHVSVGANSTIENCVVKNSIIQENATLQNKVFANSMVGNHATIIGNMEDLSVGDYTEIYENKKSE